MKTGEKKNTLKTVIKEFHHKTLNKQFRRLIDIPIDIPMVISLIGARRSGKSYYLNQIISTLEQNDVKRKNIVLLNFEDERLNLSTQDLDLILQSYLELYPEEKLEDCYFFFDEIQNVEGWEKFTRRIFDNYSKHIFITGSNSKLLSTEIADSLRGRTITYTIFPLNFKEYLAFKKKDYKLNTPQEKAMILSASREYILSGGFPELVHFPQEVKVRALQEYFNTMLYRDIVDRYKVNDTQTLKFFIKKIFANVGKPLSINKTYNDLRSMGYKVSNNYLYAYENHCQTVFMTLGISKFDFSKIKQEKSEKKVYSIDSGLLAAIEFSASQNYGKLLENCVAMELKKHDWEVFYYKDRKECDFIIKKGSVIRPIQVSWQLTDDETIKREINGGIEACKYIGGEFIEIVTYDESADLSTKGYHIQALPFYEWIETL